MKKKGFTLIELLAVIVVLAVIALIAIPNFIGYVKKSKIQSAKTSAINIMNAYKQKMIDDDSNNGYVDPCSLDTNKCEANGRVGVCEDSDKICIEVEIDHVCVMGDEVSLDARECHDIECTLEHGCVKYCTQHPTDPNCSSEPAHFCDEHPNKCNPYCIGSSCNPVCTDPKGCPKQNEDTTFEIKNIVISDLTVGSGISSSTAAGSYSVKATGGTQSSGGTIQYKVESGGWSNTNPSITNEGSQTEGTVVDCFGRIGNNKTFRCVVSDRTSDGVAFNCGNNGSQSFHSKTSASNYGTITNGCFCAFGTDNVQVCS